MTALQHRASRIEPGSALARIDRLFEEWMRSMHIQWPLVTDWDVSGEELIRVDEYRKDDVQVIRAEIPGIDPEKDITLTASDGMLQLSAQRRVEERTEDTGYMRHELHYGSMRRTLPLPQGAVESDITATYRDGILQIRVPVRPVSRSEPTRIAVTRG